MVATVRASVMLRTPNRSNNARLFVLREKVRFFVVIATFYPSVYVYRVNGGIISPPVERLFTIKL